MTFKFFVDICPPQQEIDFVLISEKNELCTTSPSTNLVVFILEVLSLAHFVTQAKCLLIKRLELWPTPILYLKTLY